jgi:hypothetical protein
MSRRRFLDADEQNRATAKEKAPRERGTPAMAIPTSGDDSDLSLYAWNGSFTEVLKWVHRLV